MKELTQTILKSLLSWTLKAIWPLLLTLICGLPTYFLLLEQKVVENPAYKEWSLKLLALLIGLSLSFFILWLKVILKYERYYQAYGVLWDKRNKMRCLNCKKPLKYSSFSPSVFHCSDPKCDSKHTLRDSNGNYLTEKEAIELKNR